MRGRAWVHKGWSKSDFWESGSKGYWRQAGHIYGCVFVGRSKFIELSQPNNQYNINYKYQRKLCEYWVIQSVLLGKCEIPMLKIEDNSKVFLHFAGLFYIAKYLYCLTYIESLFFPLTLLSSFYEHAVSPISLRISCSWSIKI